MNIGLIRVLTLTDQNEIDRHGAIIEKAFPGLSVTSGCIRNQPQGLYDEASEEAAKPKIIEGRDIAGSKHKYLLFLREVHSPELDYNRLETLIKSDSSLSVKLLRYLNSAGMGVREKISSIKQALVLLGEKPLRKWASLVAMTCLGEDKPSELVRLSLARAEFCELLGDDLRMVGRGLDLFLLGLLLL